MTREQRWWSVGLGAVNRAVKVARTRTVNCFFFSYCECRQLAVWQWQADGGGGGGIVCATELHVETATARPGRAGCLPLKPGCGRAGREVMLGC